MFNDGILIEYALPAAARRCRGRIWPFNLAQNGQHFLDHGGSMGRVSLEHSSKE